MFYEEGRKALFARNEWMVDRTSRLIAVYNGEVQNRQ